MEEYDNLFNRSYNLSSYNMKNHLRYEHEQKLNVIDSIHNENMQNLLNRGNRDNNYHFTEYTQRLSNLRKRDINYHIEEIKKLLNDGEDRDNNYHNEGIQRLSNQRNRDSNCHM